MALNTPWFGLHKVPPASHYTPEESASISTWLETHSPAIGRPGSSGLPDEVKKAREDDRYAARRALTAEQVKEIRAAPQEVSTQSLADKFGVTYQTIMKVRKCRSYRHLPCPEKAS